MPNRLLSAPPIHRQQWDAESSLPAEFPAQVLPLLNSPLTSGVLRHSTHLTDLLLAAPLKGQHAVIEHFLSLTSYLVDSVRSGVMPVVNEKIDGSPAITIGFNNESQPFIAYKGGLARTKEAQALITNVADAARWYPTGSEVLPIYEDCIQLIGPALSGSGLENYIFQADLLFTPRNNARRLEDDSVSIQANPSGLAYIIPKNHGAYQEACSAPLGLVVHSVSERVIDPQNGRISAKPLAAPQLLYACAKLLRERGLFAIHPYRFNVQLEAEETAPPFSSTEGAIAALNDQIKRELMTLGPKFSNSWKALAPKVATYLNSELYSPRKGGLYRAAAQGDSFDFEKFQAGFKDWLIMRQGGLNPQTGQSFKPDSPEVLLKIVHPFLKEHKAEFSNLMQAYFNANRIFYLLLPHLKNAFKSKLGGRPSEGFMLGQIKVVDRLTFTMRNFSGRVHFRKYPENSASTTRQNTLPAPFEVWRPGTIFFTCKAEPLQRGHAAAIEEISRRATGAPWYVVVSSKEPNFKAEVWRAFGAAPTRRELSAGNFVHAFSNRLRAALFKELTFAKGHVVFGSPSLLPAYLAKAREENREGKISLAVGEKEVAAGRYNDLLEQFPKHLELFVVPAQAGGISGTEVRLLVKAAAEGEDPQAEQKLLTALSYIQQPDVRFRLMKRLVTEWRRVSRKAKQLTS